MEWPTVVLSLVFALLDDARALATCACVSRSWRTLAAAERARLRAAYARALGEDEGNVFVDAAFSRTADPQAVRQAGWSLRARAAYVPHRRRCLAALRREADEAAPERGANLLAAHAYVQENAHRFRDHVFGPLLAELAFLEPWHAACVADACPAFLWHSFLVSTDEDYDCLCRELARFGACVARLPDDAVPEEPAAPWADVEDASGLVQAPHAVLRALCDVGRLRVTAVAEADDLAHAAQLLRRSSAPALFAMLPAAAGREAWRLCAAPRAGEHLQMPLPRCARVPDAPPLILAALGRRADWCVNAQC